MEVKTYERQEIGENYDINSCDEVGRQGLVVIGYSRVIRGLEVSEFHSKVVKEKLI